MIRPRPRVLGKKRPEVVPDFKGEGTHAKSTDHNINLGVPSKLRKGSQESMTLIARRQAAAGGI